MDHFSYLLAAYSIIFVAIFLYVIFIRSRQRRLESELRTLEARLKELHQSAAPVSSVTRSRNP